METRIVDEKDKADWDQFVKECPNVISWHRYDWCLILQKYYNLSFYPLAVYDGPNIRGILPLYHVKTVLSGNALISLPYVVAGGIVADTESVQRNLLNKAIELSKRNNSNRIILKQYKIKIKGNLATDESYYNRELRLSSTIEDIWGKISDVNKVKIQESEKCNPVLEYPSQDICQFYELLFTHNHTVGLPCESRRWIECLMKSGMYSIALLKVKGSTVAGTMVKQFRNTMSFPLTCLPDQSEESLLFAYNLYWKLITKRATEGIQIFHSGRIPYNDLTSPFRLGWGGRKHTYYYQVYGKLNGKTEFSTRRGRKRNILEGVWKRIPTSFAKIMGPAVIKQIP